MVERKTGITGEWIGLLVVLLAWPTGLWAQRNRSEVIVQQEDPILKTRVTDLKVGRPWVGGKLNVDRLRGRVTMVTFVDYRDLPCAAALYNFRRWQSRYKSKGFVLIGVHTGGTSNTARRKWISIMNRKKTSMMMYDSGSLPGVEDDVHVPYAVLFNPEGNVVWYGSPLESPTRREETIGQLCRVTKSYREVLCIDRAREICGDRKYVELRDLVEKIYGGDIGGSYQTLLAWKEKTDELGSHEAVELLKGMDTYAEKQFTLIEQYKIDQPRDAMALLRFMAKTFGGTQHGDAARQQLDLLEKDKAFKAHLAIEDAYQRLMRGVENIGAPPKDPGERATWYHKSRSKILIVQRQVDAFCKKNPDSVFSRKLAEAMRAMTPEG